MIELTGPQATVTASIITGSAALIGGVLGSFISQFLNGIGFLFKRKITKASDSERLDYQNKIYDLLKKMKNDGATQEEIDNINNLFGRHDIMMSPSNNDIINKSIIGDESGDVLSTNYEMKVRADASLSVADAQLEQVLTDCKLILTSREVEKLQEAQSRWSSYKDALADLASQQFEGGSHASLAAAMTALAETERRTSELRQMIADRSSI